MVVVSDTGGCCKETAGVEIADINAGRQDGRRALPLDAWNRLNPSTGRREKDEDGRALHGVLNSGETTRRICSLGLGYMRSMTLLRL